VFLSSIINYSSPSNRQEPLSQRHCLSQRTWFRYYLMSGKWQRDGFTNSFKCSGTSLVTIMNIHEAWLKLQPCYNQLILYTCNIPNAVCLAPPEDEKVKLEACKGLWFYIDWMKRASRWFHYTVVHGQQNIKFGIVISQHLASNKQLPNTPSCKFPLNLIYPKLFEMSSLRSAIPNNIVSRMYSYYAVLFTGRHQLKQLPSQPAEQGIYTIIQKKPQ
jgi:hypothetical protein